MCAILNKRPGRTRDNAGGGEQRAIAATRTGCSNATAKGVRACKRLAERLAWASFCGFSNAFEVG